MCQAANALIALGIGKGDRVVIYLPVIAETIIITLAVARIGAVHSLVFGGFSAEALKFRVEDTGAKLLVTTDGQFRRGKAVPVKANADAAVAGTTRLNTSWWFAAQAPTLSGPRAGTSGGMTRSDKPARSTRPSTSTPRPPVYHVHLRHHGPAQGSGPHHRRLPHPSVLQSRTAVQQS
ncbi:AMP-binding protein [Arthrobacter alpinus]|nr:AMP-binding protein [Arthrobacter alpinus]